MAVNGINYSSGNTLNFTTNDTTWASLSSGGTFSSLSLSASTYYNLPSFTGGTVTGATNFTNGLTATTISATTYQGNLVTSLSQGRGIELTNTIGDITISNYQSTLITVGVDGSVDYNSISDAVGSITDSSETKRYVIQVGPGVYAEGPIVLTSKPYISIVGSDILEVLVTPKGGFENQKLFQLGNANELSFMTISGASGSGGVGISCVNTNGFSLIHKVSMYDNETHISVYADTLDTQFYAEYVDLNGTYNYGVSVIANGAAASANLENHYNFATGDAPTIANFVSGPNSSLEVTVGNNIGIGYSGSNCFLIQDGADLNISSINISRWDYGINNPNVGNPCTFDIDGISIINSNINDLRVDQQYTTGTIQGSLSHQKISNVAPDVYWQFLDSTDGELDITRKISITFADGTHTDTSTLIFEGSTMGLVSGGTITSVGGLSAQTASGFGYLKKTGTEIYERIDWNNSVIVLSPNTNNYLYINSSSILSASNTIPNNTENIVLGRVVTNVSTIAFIDESPQRADHTSNLFSTFNRTALGPVYASGSLVTQNATPFKINVSSGDYFFSENEFSPSGGSGITFTQYYRNGSGGWNTSATTFVQSTSFDNNGTLSGLTTSAFTKHTLYVVGDGSNEKYFLVLGQAQYTTLVEAEGADLPTPPTYFNDAVTPISSIYVRQGSSNIIQFEDIRPVIGFKAAGVSATALHANLLGLTADDHKQYLLVDGSRGMSGSLNMSGNTITNSGTINGVTIETHAARHKSGGSDPVGTATPTASAIPYADAFGKLDSWITPTTINGGNNIQVTGTYPNFGINFSGGTVTGATNFTGGLSANTFSSTTATIRRITGGSGNTNSGIYSFIGGGTGNTITASTSCFSSISSGIRNTVSCANSFVGSGSGNTIGGDCGFIGTGLGNCVSVYGYSSVVNGNRNLVSGTYSLIGSGSGNCVSTTYSFVGTGFQNQITNSSYSSIGSGCQNTLQGSFSSIAGGGKNTTDSGYYGFGFNSIGGGRCNNIVADFSTISGGYKNTLNAGCGAFIGGGVSNSMSGPYGYNQGSVIVGGSTNSLYRAPGSAILGGNSNSISAGPNGNGGNNFIGGGFGNVICSNQPSGVIIYSTISGGYQNSITNSSCSSIIGGRQNIISGSVSSDFSTISGGYCNRVRCANSFIGGGTRNTITGNFSSILGGSGNTVSGAYSSAVGCGLNATLARTFYANNIIVSGTSTSTGDITGFSLVSSQSVGDEGGEIRLAKAQTNTTLSGTSVTIDIYQNRLRFFETSSPNRGVYIDLTLASSGVNTDLLAPSNIGKIYTTANNFNFL